MDHILFDEKRAAGVKVINYGESRILKANRNIILCAGVFNSAQILMRSGIGPAQRLIKLSVPVVSDLEGVGENLKDHAYVGVSARVRNIRTINQMPRNSLLEGKGCVPERVSPFNPAAYKQKPEDAVETRRQNP